jgi:4-amino-4-deoxy-L-arabinose transferase-like glycosyltransferase
VTGATHPREASTTTRPGAGAQPPWSLYDAAALLIGLGVLLISTVPNLGNHPSVTDDEMWVFSGAYKLAAQGVFGSDMFAGFFNADSHYFFNMPGHHFVLAAAFKLMGYGILQARLVGVLYAIATLLLTYLLARRIYGVAVAMLSIALLLFLRLNMGFDTGLPLQELAASMRYDLAPVPFLLAGVLLLLDGPSPLRSVLAGLLFGLAVLLQFYGAFIFPIAIVFLWQETLPRETRLKLISVLLGAALLVGIPYGVYIAAHYDDFQGQAGTIDNRADFTSPRFYIDNLRHEPERFLRPLAFKEVPKGEDPQLVSARTLSLREMAVRRPSAKLGVLVGVPLSLLFLGWRALKQRSRGDTLLFLCLGGLVLQFALFESAKFYIYWIPLVPFLCIGIAAVVGWLLRPRVWERTRLVAVAATLVAMAIVFGEGSAARVSGLRVARDAGSYDGLANTIHREIPAGSRVVGATSLWWALHDTDYRSYFLFFYLTRGDAGKYRETIDGFMQKFDPQYLVLTRIAGQELDKHLSPPDLQAWHAYMAAHAHKVVRIEGPEARGYGYVDVWKLE